MSNEIRSLPFAFYEDVLSIEQKEMLVQSIIVKRLEKNRTVSLADVLGDSNCNIILGISAALT